MEEVQLQWYNYFKLRLNLEADLIEEARKKILNAVKNRKKPKPGPQVDSRQVKTLLGNVPDY